MSFALFLDVDGVLNTRTTVVGAPSGRTGIDESRVRLLKKALKQFGDAEIVLTSDWKLMREDGDDFSYLVSMLGKFGLSLSGKTTDVWVGRGEGIQSYLAEHPEIDEYVILDDNTFDFANYNSALNTRCSSCGAERGAKDKGYFDVRKEQDARNARNASGTGTAADGQKGGQGNRKRGHSFGAWKIVLIGMLVIAAIIGLTAIIAMPKKRTVTVRDMTWKTSVDVEKYILCDEDDWELPEGATLKTTKQEVHHTEQEYVGEREETYDSYEVIGSHVEYSYEDNGDGTFSEVANDVDDYGYVTRTRSVPVYRDKPIYRTKYYYTIWRWKYDRTETAEGGGKTPEYPDPQLTDKERLRKKSVEYEVTCEVKDKEKTYKVEKSIYDKLDIGETYKVRADSEEIVSIIE